MRKRIKFLIEKRGRDKREINNIIQIKILIKYVYYKIFVYRDGFLLNVYIK